MRVDTSADFVSNIVAPLATLAIAVPVYRAFYLSRLDPSAREILRNRWVSREYRFRTLGAGGVIALAVVFSSAAVTRVPPWAAFVAWAITWPLLAYSFSRWSLALRRNDPATWEQLMSGGGVRRTAIPTSSLVGHTVLAITPGVLLLWAARG